MLCFLYSALRPPSIDLSLLRPLPWLGARRSLSLSALFSIRVARCTRVSAVSQMMSDTGSFGSILSRCWRMERKGIS